MSILSIASSLEHTLFLRANGTVLGRGYNTHGQLPEDSRFDILFPQKNTISIAVGEKYSLLLNADGILTSYGEFEPIAERVFKAFDIISISSGFSHSLFLSRQGDVYAYGSNYNGQLGITASKVRMLPFRIPSLSNIISVVCGQYHSLFLKADGTVYGCGDNTGKQISPSNNDKYLTPTSIPLPTRIVSLAAGSLHSLFLDANGDVYGYSNNFYGQLGMTDENGKILGLPPIVQIVCGNLHSLFLDKLGNVYALGSNGHGQLGVGSSVQQTDTPIQIRSLKNIRYIAAGPFSSFFIDIDGIVYGCGTDNSDRLRSPGYPTPFPLEIHITKLR